VTVAPIRIAHVLNTMGLGGVSAVAYELLRRLPAGRYEHVVYALRRAADNADAHARQVARFTELGATVRFPRDDTKKTAVVAEMCEWLRDDGVDVLHTHSYKPNIYGRLAGSLHGGPRMVAHYHNVYDQKWAADGTFVYEELLAPRTARRVACSAAVADHVAGRLGLDRSSVDVIANGVDVDRFAAPRPGAGAAVRAGLGIDPAAPVAGIVGRISVQKAQDVLLRAAPAVLEGRPDTVFVVAGGTQEPRFEAEVRALARSLGIASRVRFVGHVADAPALYAALDVLATPSRWEGYGLVLAEAMAAGVPVVASDIPAIREVTGNGAAALLVAPDDPAALAAGLAGVLARPALAEDLAVRGRALARRWSWDGPATALDELYLDLVAAGAPAAL
jgi:glycosyltransferase involved in cell wall biosynthesis